METKKIFLISDICIQVLLILTAIWLQFNSNDNYTFFGIDEDAFTCFYFVFGGWQVLSCIFHAIFYKKDRNTLRKVYHILLFVHLGLPLLSILGFLILLYTSPGMGIYYLIICVIELNKLQNENQQA